MSVAIGMYEGSAIRRYGPLWTVDETPGYLDVPPETVRGLVEFGELHGVWCETELRIPSESLGAFLEKGGFKLEISDD